MKKNQTILDINGYQLNKDEFKYVLKTVSASFDDEIARLQNNSTLLKKWVVDQLINEQALIEEANRRNIVVEENDLKKQLNSKEQDIVQNKETQFINDRIKRKFISQRVIDKLFEENVNISNEEILDYYKNNRSQFDIPDQCRFRQIMVSDKNKAHDAKKKIREGLDFVSAVEEYDESAYKEKGGDTGFVDRQLLPSFLGKACDILEIGEISDVFESPYGYCIVMLVDKRNAQILSLDINRKNILNELRQAKGQVFLNDWLAEKRKKIVTVIKWEEISEISY